MNPLYATIISDADEARLLSIAEDFSAKIELIEGGVLFDISGLEKLMGTQETLCNLISQKMKKVGIAGNLGISEHLETSILFARNLPGATTDTGSELSSLPLESLAIEDDVLMVLEALGTRSIAQLKKIPAEELIARFGQDFRGVLDLVNNQGSRKLTPNIKAQNVEWNFELEYAVEELERLVFILASGIGEVLQEATKAMQSTEHITLIFELAANVQKRYEIRVSFPTLNINFWRKIIDHYISQSLPEGEIHSIKLICYYTKPRTAQLGLYSAARPEPENLHLTLNKIKKLVGEENAGVPRLLDARKQKPFLLDSTLQPRGAEQTTTEHFSPKIAFTHYNPPLPALVWIKNRKLVYLKTKEFEGKVKTHGGVWRGSSFWWTRFWKADEWDVELENGGVFRLVQENGAWIVTGEYD
ncbi:MAG: hypothetical protein ACK5NT_15605 [Pyrinomonadaceae bacterium]